MLPIASPREIAAIARAGRVVDAALAAAREHAKPGATPRELADIVLRVIVEHGASAVLKGFAGSASQPVFPSAACICVNEHVVHAVPNDVALRVGDIITIDTAAALEGWHADAATTVVVGAAQQHTSQPTSTSSSNTHALCALAHRACDVAVAACIAGSRWSTVAAKTRSWVHEQRASLIAGYHGHGIGQDLHAPPTCWFEPSLQEARDGTLHDFELLPGMVLCIEPIVTLSKAAPTLVVAPDQWTVLTRDRSPAAFVERCIAIDRAGPRVLAG